jgi:putative sugar O-methyltransferase
MNSQARKKSWWSTFKNSHIKSHNLKKFYEKLDKKNISDELNQTLNFFVNSESYNWSSKFWRRLVINHLKLISEKSFKNSEDILGKEYFTFTHFNDALIKDACKIVENNMINLKVNIFKKQKNFSYEESINHNILIFLLYENIKDRDVFKKFEKIQKLRKDFHQEKPSININQNNLSQDDLNSLFEFEKIENLLEKIPNKKGNFIEIGSGAGRTTQTILSLKEKIKYVIADIPPAINLSYKNIKNLFPEKKVSYGFEIENEKDFLEIYEKKDVIYILPHQIKFLPKNFFDISIAIDCLHEMEEKIVERYVSNFEKISLSFYFKVWEYAGLPNSFYKYYSAHNKNDYFIKESWNEVFKEKCIFPSNYYQFGYKF